MRPQPISGQLRSGARSLLLALLLLSVPVAFVTAQGPALTIEQASLRLWPEYDDPGLLVIFAGQFTDTGTFPQRVLFPIAEGARNIQATYQDASGNLLMREYELVEGKLAYEMPLPTFHYEYYVDRPPSDNQREIVFNFDPGYAAKALEVVIQEPARATDFSMSPTEQSNFRGADGLTYHVINLTNVAAGNTVNLTIRYTKNDANLTKAQLSVANEGAGVIPTTAAAEASTPWLPYVLIGLGVVLLIGAFTYWYLVQRRPGQARAAANTTTGGKRSTDGKGKSLASGAPARNAPRPTVRATGATPVGKMAVFCTQCGHELQETDRFCPQCGTPRR